MTAPRRRIAFDRIASAALMHSEPICRQWLPGGRVQAGEYVVRNPKRVNAGVKVHRRNGAKVHHLTDVFDFDGRGHA